jgi:hypothetical protein
LFFHNCFVYNIICIFAARLRSPLRISPKLSGFLPKIESTIKPNRKFSFFPKRKQSYNINRRTTTTVFRYDRKNSELLVSKCSTIERPGHKISSKATQRHSLTSRTQIVDDMCADHRNIIPTEGIPMYTNGSRYCWWTRILSEMYTCCIDLVIK